MIEKLGSAFGILAAISAALAAMWLHQLRGGQYLQRWMSIRAKAESHRIDYFAKATASSRWPADPWSDLLRLEYFRRYQLDVQRAFLASRGNDHRDQAERTLRLGGIAAGLAALSAALGGVLGATDGNWTALGAVSVISGALSAYAGAREAMSQDRRNAERYERTLDALTKLSARLGETRRAVAQGHRDALHAYVAAVNEQISLEHRQWLESSDAANAGIASLDQALGQVEAEDQAQQA